ncbi:MAG: hypothetical protein M3280_13265 [Actinomycetota bacterium]|nr:hypothetical protein [Actinomycetota bacterium]
MTETTRRDALVAGSVAAIVSGAPSTLYALRRGRSLSEATAAAGSILLPNETRTPVLVAAAVPVHIGVSLFWAAVFERSLPRQTTALWGGLAGAGVAALDLLVIGRRLPRIRALPLGPQFADHILFGITVGAVLRARRSHRS